MDGTLPKPRVEPGTLLRVSEHFLRRGFYNDCRQYAQQASQIDPNFPGVSKMLAVADVLLASKCRFSIETLRDWYAVLQLDRFSHDFDLIQQRFNHLCGLLDPRDNKLPFADEAFELVANAWYVLSNPLKKLEFDDLLKRLLDVEQSKDDSGVNFWTVCPYCYHVYEYPRAYLDLCLRCPNEKCLKAFTCLEIDRPPEEVLIEGKYICSGFLRRGFQHGSWNPFAPLNKQEVKASDANGGFVELSDDDEVETNRENDARDAMPPMKQAVRRKKLVAKNTKKVTGVGNRVTKEGFVHQQESDLIVHSFSSDDDSESNIDPTSFGEVEFHETDDDIFVSLQNCI